MTQLSGAHIAAMKKVDWDTEQAKESDDVKCNPYALALTKETSTLHRVLSRYVPPADVKMVILPIFSHYEAEWSAALKSLQIKTAPGIDR